MGNPRTGRAPGRGRGRGGGGGNNPLHDAARMGDLVKVQSILCSNPLVINSRDRHSRTPLHLAAWSGQTEVVGYLCSNKADVGASAMDDMGAIHFASQKGHLEVVRVLISSGVSVKVSNRKGFTPLHYAVKGSHLELTKYLIKKGSSLTSKTKAGETPADLASNEEVRLFLQDFEKSLLNDEKAENKNTNDDEPMQVQSVGKEDVTGKHDNRQENGDDADDDDDDDGSAAELVVEEEHGDGSEKRKSENIENEESSIKPKRTKIELGHLLAENDLQEEEEDEFKASSVQ